MPRQVETSKPAMLTMEARVRDPAACQVLLGLLEFDGQQRRRLFKELHIQGADPKDLKRSYTQIMTARHFNSLLFSVQDMLSALTELKKENVLNKQEKIKSAEKWLKDKEKRVRDLSAWVKALTSYRDAKRRAIKAKKRLRIPKKLRPLDLATLAAERATLLEKIHHKRRYIISAKRRLAELEAQSTASVCFGSKELFQKQFHLEENGYASHEEWAEDFAFARSSSTMFIGSRDESAGNQTAQYDPESKTLSLRLPKTTAFEGFPNHRLVISDLSFPEKYRPHIEAALRPAPAGSKKTDKVTSPVQVRIVKRKKCGGKETAVYVQLTCQPLVVPVVTSKAYGAIGIDLNADHLAICETDRFGNFVRAESLAFDLKTLSSDQATAVLGDYVAAVVAMAKAAGKPIAIEKLDFRVKKARLREEGATYARMLSQFAYAKFQELVRSRCAAEGVGLIHLNPAYSSVIGVLKFYGLDITSHEKAALVLARRALGFSERAKVFQGTRRPPARMAFAEETGSGSKDSQPKSRHRARHVWSLWARHAKTLRASLLRGRKRRPRVSESFGECYHKHPLVAKAAGVMSLAEIRGRQDHAPSESQGSGEAACPATERRPVNHKVDQVCVSL